MRSLATQGWRYLKKITINNNKVTGNLTNFPILLNLISDDDLSAHANPDGDDIVFMDGEGVASKLSHEIEYYNSTNGALVAWVNVTHLSSSEDTKLYMYYGNNDCDNQQDPDGVWDSSFQGVWHLKEDPSGSTPQMYDSTLYDNHGTSYGSMTSDDSAILEHMD